MTELDKLIKDKKNFKVLIVDDKANMRRTIRNMLRVLGFTSFREAEDGDVALKKLRSEDFNLVLCDWNMPRMSGVEVLRQAREDERFKDLAFIMVTAEVGEATVAESIESDVDGYIIKPFVPKTLEKKITEIMAKRLTPSELDTRLQVAEVLVKAGNYTEAHRELDKAAQISPRSPKLHYFRGLIFEGQGNLEQAEKAFLKAREMGPKFIKAHEKLAEIYEKTGRVSEMSKIIKEAVQISPKNPDRQAKLGEALLAEGRIQEAKKAFNEAIHLDPDNAARQTAVGEAFLAKGLSHEAELAFQASLEANPEDIYVYNRLGIAFRRQGKYQEAIANYRKALAIDPHEEYLHYNLGRAYLEAEDKTSAVAALKKALELSPDFSEARELLRKIEGE